MFTDRDWRASDIASYRGQTSSGQSCDGQTLALAQQALDRLGKSDPLPLTTANALLSSSASSSASRPSPASVSVVTTPEPLPLAAGVTPSIPSTSPASLLKTNADFNTDGRADLIWRNYATGQNTVWLMDGATRLSSTTLMSVADLNWRIEGLNDFTGDGKTDIVWRNYVTGQNALWVMDGTTLRSSLYFQPVGDFNWQIQGTVDFTGDDNPDLLWRNYATGENVIWALNGTTLRSTLSLPTVAGTNLRIRAATDLTQDGKPEILWQNDLSGETFIWSLNGTTIASTTFLPAASDANWQIQGAVDSNQDGNPDLLWRNLSTGQNRVWLLDGLKDTGKRSDLLSVGDTNWRVALQDTYTPSSAIKLSDFSFSKLEGDTGTLTVRLTQAPTANVTLTFSTGNFTVVDADSTVANGTQNTLTFTPQNWQTARTVSFIAEKDNTSADRLLGNTVRYTLSGGLTGSGVYELGKVTNTYAPDPTRFNIDLDFRNDPSGFWTPQHRAIAQKAADDWATKIANEWTDFQLDSTLGKLDANSTRPYSFTTKRSVDDLLIFLNPYQGTAGLEAGNGGPDYQFGGWISSPELRPRVGQVALNADSFSATNDPTGWLLYQVVTHEIGHVLGLVGLNWVGYNLVDRATPQTAVFKGEYAKAANGGNYVPLQSQDGANPVTGTYDYSHPADSVQSIMSYGWLYRVYAPTTVDYAMLADSGYRVYGFNA
ncbi:MAG: hypothetical protein KME27_27385 [Lyngbya sp. HA4199-MV5]|jgi:hypothetical protein|nr:hypothetical protein [Lyngbya sp. HA4199-MV5]